MTRKLAIAALAAGFAAGLAAAAGVAAADERRVTCRSNDYRRAICRIDPDAVEVQLRRQLGAARCVAGRSWGVRRGEIWVEDGCAAEFTVYSGRRSGDRDRRVTCRSNGYRYEVCRIGDGALEVQLVRRLSDSACVLGRTWGYEPGRIWVDRGCAGEFDVVYGGGGRPPRDDRGRGRLDRLFAEREAIRACRRYGEDHPDRLGANWAEARPSESFRAEYEGGRRGAETWTVSGRFETWRRGRENDRRARCLVRGDRVVRFDLR